MMTPTSPPTTKQVPPKSKFHMLLFVNKAIFIYKQNVNYLKFKPKLKWKLQPVNVIYRIRVEIV